MGVRGVLAGLLALLAAAVSIANAVVRSEADSPARLSDKIWPNHPLTLRSLAMAEIGQAAARGELPSGETMERVRGLAARAPLEPEPFLVEAALAQKRGDSARAGQLLLQARRRDPRSSAARYLLADHYIRNGDIVAGLTEMTVLSRLVPGAVDQLVPGLVAYARTPGAIPKLRQLFKESPDLQPVLLSALASDAANADVVLAIADRSASSGAEQWRAKLLKSLVDQRQYARAYAIWSRFAGLNAPPRGLYRPDFTPSAAPPPFNWTLAQAGGGVAEPLPGGGLRVLHYGRKQTTLASQLTLLEPGRYVLSMSITGEIGSDGQLRWGVRCLPSRESMLELRLTRANARNARGQFEIPASGCAAQQIELIGMLTDMPNSTDAAISPLRLSKVGA